MVTRGLAASNAAKGRDNRRLRRAIDRVVVLVEVTVGITEASTTLRPFEPVHA
jgi:hypothetical protein